MTSAVSSSAASDEARKRDRRWRRRYPRRPRVVRPEFNEKGEPTLVDIYQRPVTEPRRRLRGCRCGIPCLGFTCASSHHRGARATPWCKGCDDWADAEERLPPDERDALNALKPAERAEILREIVVERCDDCWCKVERTRAARRVVHWFNTCSPGATCECGYAPRQGQEERQTHDGRLVTCRRCIAVGMKSKCDHCRADAREAQRQLGARRRSARRRRR